MLDKQLPGKGRRRREGSDFCPRPTPPWCHLAHGTSSSQGPRPHGDPAEKSVRGFRAGGRQGVPDATLHPPSHHSRRPLAAPTPAPRSGHPSCPHCQPFCPPGAPCWHTNTETLQALSPRQGHRLPPAPGAGPPFPSGTHLSCLVPCVCLSQRSPSPRVPPSPPCPGQHPAACLPAQLGAQGQAGPRSTLPPGCWDGRLCLCLWWPAGVRARAGSGQGPAGSRYRRAGSRQRRAGSGERWAGSRYQGAGSGQGAGSDRQVAGTNGQGAGRDRQGGSGRE